MSISLIIPTMNAEEFIEPLFEALDAQTLKPDEILIVDSSSEDGTLELCRKHERVEVISINREEFDHGRTRDMAIRRAKGDLILFLTQDAVPADEHYVENLTAPLIKGLAAIASGRQLPKADARPAEKLVRAFNYPEISFIRSEEDLPRLGIKTFFFSDACSAYKKEVYLALGGFDYPVLTDEDLFFAAKLIYAGEKIAYCADAAVYHSHNLSLKEQYRRNYIQGVEFKRHEELLKNVSLESEGFKMVKYVLKGLIKEGKALCAIGFCFDCAARFLGSRAGRR